MKLNWIEHFESNYMPCLAEVELGEKRASKRGLSAGLYNRAQGFQTIFHLLLNQSKDQYNIVETGTMRKLDSWKDGQSSRLFVEFVESYGGSVRSVDIDPVACAESRQNVVSDRFSVTCNDSVEFLASLDASQVDLFYLDSWNVKWEDDQPSAEHHLREFLAIEQRIRSGAIVAIDDNARFVDTGRRTGKGRLIVEYLEKKNIFPIHDAYQIIYKF